MPDDEPTLTSLFTVDTKVAKQCIFNGMDGSIWDNVTVPRFFRKAAAERVAGKLDALLAIPLSDMLASAFNCCRDFAKYADGKPHDVRNFGFSLESDLLWQGRSGSIRASGCPHRDVRRRAPTCRAPAPSP